MKPKKLMIWTTAGVGAAAMTLWSGDVQAFFPPLPTASNDPITVTNPPTSSPILINPITREPIRIEPNTPLAIPPVSPPPFVPPPNVPQTVPPICVHPPTPQNVPEPGTILAASLGLAAVVVARKSRLSAKAT